MQFLEVCSCFSVYNDANLPSNRDVISNRLFTEHNTTQSQMDFMQIAEEVAPVNKDLSDRWGSVYSATEIHRVSMLAHSCLPRNRLAELCANIRTRRTS